MNAHRSRVQQARTQGRAQGKSSHVRQGAQPSSGSGMAGGNDHPNVTHAPANTSGVFELVRVLSTAREEPPEHGGL